MRDYIGRCKHGNVVSWLAGDCSAKEVRAFVAGLLRDGRDLDRMDRRDVKKQLLGCNECRTERTAHHNAKRKK